MMSKISALGWLFLFLAVTATLRANGKLIRVEGPSQDPADANKDLYDPLSQWGQHYVTVKIVAGRIYNSTSVFQLLIEKKPNNLVSAKVTVTMDGKTVDQSYTSGPILLKSKTDPVADIGFSKDIVSLLPTTYSNLSIDLAVHKFNGKEDISAAVSSIATDAAKLAGVGVSPLVSSATGIVTSALNYFGQAKIAETLGGMHFDIPIGSDERKAGWYVFFLGKDQSEYATYDKPNVHLSWDSNRQLLTTAEGAQVTGSSYLILRIGYQRRITPDGFKTATAFRSLTVTHPWAGKYMDIADKANPNASGPLPDEITSGVKLDAAIAAAHTLLVHNTLIVPQDASDIDADVRKTILKRIGEYKRNQEKRGNLLAVEQATDAMKRIDASTLTDFVNRAGGDLALKFLSVSPKRIYLSGRGETLRSVASGCGVDLGRLIDLNGDLEAVDPARTLPENQPILIPNGQDLQLAHEPSLDKSTSG